MFRMAGSCTGLPAGGGMDPAKDIYIPTFRTAVLTKGSIKFLKIKARPFSLIFEGFYE